MTRRVILHTGLHKTATTYLQNYIFSQLPEERWIYNHDKLVYYVMDLITSESLEEREKQKNLIRLYLDELLKAKPTQNLFVSFEGMSGDLFGGYYNQEQIHADLYDVFSSYGDVELIVFLRFQPNWIKSCYKESIYEYQIQSYEDFVNYKGGGFKLPKGKFNENGCQSINAKFLDYSKLLDSWKKRFGTVHVFFQENLRSDEKLLVQGLSEIFGEALTVREKRITVHKQNVGLTWFSINLMIWLKSVLSALGLRFIFPKPIHFFGEGKYICGIEQYEIERNHITKHRLNRFKLSELKNRYQSKELTLLELVRIIIFKLYLIGLRPLTYRVYKIFLNVSNFKQWNSFRKFLKYFIDNKLKVQGTDKSVNVNALLDEYYRDINSEFQENFNIRMPDIYTIKKKSKF